jgi:hypothetical protein
VADPTEEPKMMWYDQKKDPERAEIILFFIEKMIANKIHTKMTTFKRDPWCQMMGVWKVTPDCPSDTV